MYYLFRKTRLGLKFLTTAYSPMQAVAYIYKAPSDATLMLYRGQRSWRLAWLDPLTRKTMVITNGPKIRQKSPEGLVEIFNDLIDLALPPEKYLLTTRPKGDSAAALEHYRYFKTISLSQKTRLKAARS